MSNKVYILSQFFNELDILEIRLATLYDIVDYFVISESTYTHSGKSKDLYFQNNKQRYNPWMGKIIHQIVRDTPSNWRELINMRAHNFLHQRAIEHVIGSNWFDKTSEPYLRDDYEKEILVRALLGYDDDDIIVIGDLDEIPNPVTLNNIISQFKKYPDEDRIFHLKQEMFYYYFNLQKRNEPWLGPIVLRAKTLIDKGFCSLRNSKEGTPVLNGGWHFTYMGGVDRIYQKIQAFSAQEYNTPMVMGELPDAISGAISTGRDLFYRPAEWVIRDIEDGTFPEYIADNQEKFSDYIYIP